MDENPYKAPQTDTFAAPSAFNLHGLKKFGFRVLFASAIINSVFLVWLVVETLF